MTQCPARTVLAMQLAKCLKFKGLLGLLGAQLDKCLTLAQVMHDLTFLAVHEFEPHMGLCADSMEPALDPLSPSLSAPPWLSLSLSLSLSKIK